MPVSNKVSPMFPQAESATPSIAHRFCLRDGLEVVFDLPRDLTEREAARLRQWIKSLPFKQDEPEF